ncbi:translation initiation factor IF-2 [Geomonas subterranea]|uniref:Translation initiation factor IF-2 n=1 Tax=Geomonas subterranea TaxID=2847989 RepID=A0ABX8LJY9_9BACT|nr:translation initiation factor IF-2 [Geomonas subterranea]QXE91137.1 translation initiation factor IF-2 [Geomonas subterranea]QXM10776.1 translation initiation factor IF-2 [Geomonas subterranea]
MSKTRVYELAQQMGIDNKELMARLAEAGVQVKNHMAVLEDSDIKAVSAPAQTPHKEVSQEEVRVKPTLIRRRAKAVEPEAPVAAEPAEPEKVEEPAVVEKAAPVEEAPKRPEPVRARIIEAAPAPKPVAKPEAQAPQAPPVKEEEPAAAEKPAPAAPVAAEKPAVEAPKAEAAPAAPAVAPEAAKPAEQPAAEAVPAKAPEAAAAKVEPEPDKPTATRARILGRVEIPIPTQRPAERREYQRPAQGERPAPRPGMPRGVERPGTERPAPRPGAGRPGDRPTGPRPDRPAPLTPIEPPPLLDDRGRKGRKPAPAGGTDFGKNAKKGGAVAGKGKKDSFKDMLDKRERVFEPGPRSKGKKGKYVEKVQIGKKTEITVPKAIKRIIKISESITVGELAKRMGIKATDLIRALMKLGVMATINHPLDFDTATLLATDFGYEIENVALDVDELLEAEPDAPEAMQKRPPVVTIMGHVDHGKTSLLDAIRQANVIAGEAGGITQHIGAYDVELKGQKITFLDTPGHEAFTAMRARGAKVTDIVILVVAADDGVMPQTREAVNHSKAAGVPIIVAINKIDKPEANPSKVKQELMEFGLVSEEWGGETIFVEVSAKKHLNLESLLEMVLLQADVLELKANPDKTARGTVVEAKLDKGRGPVATVLVQEGTLRAGDYFVAGIHFGRVRAMQNDRGEKVIAAGPAMPVEVIGFNGVPDAGDIFVAMTDEKQAKEIANHRQMKLRESELAKHSKLSLEQLYEKIQKGEVKDLNTIVKGDVQGSVEAVAESLRKLTTDAIRLNVLHASVGAITETDVNLASASNAIILGFNVRPEVKAAALAEKEGVDVRLYNIIYDAVDDIKKAMEGLLEPTFKEKYLGRAEIREVFSVPKAGMVAGSYVTDGKIIRNAQVRLLRDNVVVFEGKLGSLRRFKDDVKEVATGYECGMSLESYNDLKIGDIFECFEMEKVAGKL